MSLVAFDLEIAKQIPSKYILTHMRTRQRSPEIFNTHGEAEKRKSLAIDGVNWYIDSVPDDFMAHWPLGISVAATTGIHGRPSAWYGKEGSSKPLSKMTKHDCGALVNYLLDCHESGDQIITWNGLRFDFHVLAEESGMYAECAELARNHVDLMFIIFCMKGFYAKLDNCAKVMLGEQKTEGVNGAFAPELWARGEYETVIEYVCQDVALTAKLAQYVALTAMIEWTSSSSGKLHGINIRSLIKDGRLPTVMECLEIPEPDTSWMDNPPKRSDFFEWMK